MEKRVSVANHMSFPPFGSLCYLGSQSVRLLRMCALTTSAKADYRRNAGSGLFKADKFQKKKSLNC